MSEPRRASGAKTARIVLGVLALLLGVGLLLSVFLLGRSVEDAEAGAQTRAVNWTNSVLVGNLTGEQLESPLVGPVFREVLAAVQSGIRSDGRVARVRIWNTSGALVFSDDQEDQVGEVVATDIPQIQTALEGQAVSVTSPTTVPAEGGLAGSDEQLFESFVPLRPDAELGVAGVAQIDQRYDDIVDGWSETWTAIRLGLGIALGVVVILFLVTLRRRPVPVEAVTAPAAAGAVAARGAPPVEDRRPQDRAAKDEVRLRELTERLAKAEAAKTEAETIANEAAAHFAELEDRVAKAEERAASAEVAAQAAAKAATGGRTPRRGVPGVGAVAATVAAGELDERVQEAEGKLERSTGEVARLRAALAERDAELALAREGGTVGEDVDEIRRQASEHEGRAAAAEQRALEAEQRISALEGELQSAQGALAEAASTAKPKRGHRDRHADEELKAAQAQATELQAKLAEAEMALEDIRGKLTEGESRATELEAANTSLVDELETLRVESAKANDELATLRETVAEAEREATSTEADERVAATTAALAEVQAKLADAERDRAELLAQLERYRQAGEGTGDDDVQGLRARVAELEDVRRADVAELQRAQETLANTQFEATQARRQVKELERQLREALGRAEPVVATEPAEEQAAAPAATPRRRAPKEPPPEPAFEPEEPAAEPEPEPAEEELSLRERLARAAAARHRMSGTPDADH